MKENPTRMPYHLSNQPNYLKMNNSNSEFLAQPLEVHLSENMSRNLRGETIFMACSCFLEKQRDIQKENLDYSTQGFSLKQIFRSGKLRRKENNDEVNNSCQENVMKPETHNTQVFTKQFRNESPKTSSQTSSISNLLKINNP
jgi:hypothetical protein